MAIQCSTVRKLAELAHTAPSADNSQPWKLTWDGEILAIAYDFERVKGVTFPAESPATLLAMGAVIEILLTAAEDWALEPSLTLSDSLPDENSEIYARIQFHGEERSNPPDTGSHPSSMRHTNRLSYLKRLIPESLSQELLALRENSARLVLLRDPKEIRETANIATIASEVRFQTEEVHQWLGKSLRFSTADAKRGDGMDVTTLGLPPGGKLFLRLISNWNRMRLLNKIGTYKVVSRIDTAPLKKAPGLLAVVAHKDERGTLDAGRLLTRAWIYLNKNGLSAHPYYVISDQLARLRSNDIPKEFLPELLSVEQRSGGLFNLARNETVHMLFRVGYSKSKPQPSQRLPLNTVYNEKSHP